MQESAVAMVPRFLSGHQYVLTVPSSRSSLTLGFITDAFDAFQQASSLYCTLCSRFSLNHAWWRGCVGHPIHTLQRCKSLNCLMYSRFHWSLITGPKKEDGGNTPGLRFHARDSLREGEVLWSFEAIRCRILASVRLLARVRIAKVKNMDRLCGILQEVPVTPDTDGWNCVQWTRDALRRLDEDGEALGENSVLQWEVVRDQSMNFVQRVLDHQRQCREAMQPSEIDPYAKATLDLLHGGEFIP